MHMEQISVEHVQLVAGELTELSTYSTARIYAKMLTHLFALRLDLAAFELIVTLLAVDQAANDVFAQMVAARVRSLICTLSTVQDGTIRVHPRGTGRERRIIDGDRLGDDAGRRARRVRTGRSERTAQTLRAHQGHARQSTVRCLV